MELELILIELRPFKVSRFLACWLWTLYNQLLPQFQWIFLKLCRHFVNILKHVGFLVELELILIEYWPFKFSHFGSFLHCRVSSLCNQPHL